MSRNVELSLVLRSVDLNFLIIVEIFDALATTIVCENQMTNS